MSTPEAIVENKPKRKYTRRVQVDTNPKPNYKIDLSKAIKLRIEKNNTYEEIAKQFDVSKQAVEQRLKPYELMLGNPEQVSQFDRNKDHVLSAAQAKLLVSAIDPEKINKSSTLQLTTAFSQLFDKQRLIRGESTENLNIKSMAMHLKGQIDADEQALRELEDQVSESDPVSD